VIKKQGTQVAKWSLGKITNDDDDDDDDFNDNTITSGGRFGENKDNSIQFDSTTNFDSIRFDSI